MGVRNGWPATESTTKNHSATVTPARIPPTAPCAMTACSGRFMVRSLRSPRVNMAPAPPPATVGPRDYGAVAGRFPILVPMAEDTTPPELPPELVRDYLIGMRAVIAQLVAIADRLSAAGHDREALAQLQRETHKIHGSAGSFGFPVASRLAAGMEVTVKDWVSRPDDRDVDRGSLAHWFVTRLAEMLELDVPRRAAGPRPASGTPPRLILRRPSAVAPAPTQRPLETPRTT